MKKKFKSIALIGGPDIGISDTLNALIEYLKTRRLNIVLEEKAATLLPNGDLPTSSIEQLGKHCDLAIVIGGDGSLLNAARHAADQQIPLLGINRGRLGFLTDIRPNELHKIGNVLEGEYEEEKRFLLEATIQGKKDSQVKNALNEVALLPGRIARLIEFGIYINNRFVCNHRADGIIIATPTGSTAHALSGGGPILHPALDAIVLVPMFPHTLSSRPIVVDGNSRIDIIISKNNKTAPSMSCDGQNCFEISLGTKISIQKKSALLHLIHPTDYHYFQTLREKLHWENNH